MQYKGGVGTGRKENETQKSQADKGSRHQRTAGSWAAPGIQKLPGLGPPGLSREKGPSSSAILLLCLPVLCCEPSKFTQHPTSGQAPFLAALPGQSGLKQQGQAAQACQFASYSWLFRYKPISGKICSYGLGPVLPYFGKTTGWRLVPGAPHSMCVCTSRHRGKRLEVGADSPAAGDNLIRSLSCLTSRSIYL